MILALLLALVVTAAGAVATYIYDEGASLATRLCTGACLGLAAFGLIAFVLAAVMGLTPLSIGLATILTAAPLALLLEPARREQLNFDYQTCSRAVGRALLHPTGPDIVYFLYYTIAAIVMWLLFKRAMIVKPEGIYTGVLNNFGDLPFHLSVVTGFAFGNNYPPEDPTYAGVRFTYPFLTDFISAVFVRCGASLRDSLFLENFLLAMSFVGVMHRWAWEMLRDRVAALLTPLLILLNGGFGWKLLFKDSENNHEGLYGLLKQLGSTLKHLPPSFTVIPETSWRWGNAISSLLLPQRGILLGLPLAVIVFTQWWLATREKQSAGAGAERPAGGASKAKARKRKDKKTRDWEARKLGSERSHQAFSASRPGSWLSFLTPSPTTRMIAAGVIAGSLPLIHAHTFVVLMGMGGCIALWVNWRAWIAALLALVIPLLIIRIALPGVISDFNVKALMMSDFIRPLVVAVAVSLVVALWFLLDRWQRRLWFCFFVCALLIAVPQMKWSTSGSAVNAANFFAWEFGWDSGKELMFHKKLEGTAFSAQANSLDVAWFWLKNTGLFVPLLITAILWRGKKYLVSRRLLLFYLPFTLCFIVPNMVKLAPWIWDNVKVLFYWWVASAPLVALLLSRLWKLGTWRRPLAVALFVCLTLAGALDVAGIVLRSGEYQLFDPFGIKFAEVVKEQTQPRSTIIHAPVHNTPVFLTGRRSLMGYPGHIWTHGLVFSDRESEIKRIYSGAPDAELLLKKYDVDYAVVGPLEKLVMPVNEQFFSRFQKVGQSGEYRLYKIFH